MKKILLSGLVVLAFFFYSILQRGGFRDDDDAPLPDAMTPTPTLSLSATPKATGNYKDGSYTGDVADAYYGNIQVRVTITGGNITAVKFLQYPNDRDQSIEINTRAMPRLESEAIQAQSANVNIVSGATESSHAYILSLQSALTKAQG